MSSPARPLKGRRRSRRWRAVAERLLIEIGDDELERLEHTVAVLADQQELRRRFAEPPREEEPPGGHAPEG